MIFFFFCSTHPNMASHQAHAVLACTGADTTTAADVRLDQAIISHRRNRRRRAAFWVIIVGVFAPISCIGIGGYMLYDIYESSDTHQRRQRARSGKWSAECCHVRPVAIRHPHFHYPSTFHYHHKPLPFHENFCRLP
jgi:hypothetical protein